MTGGAANSADAPVLSLEQLRKELEALHSRGTKTHRSLRSALFAQLADGEEGTLVPVRLGPEAEEETFRIVVASGELHLRMSLVDEPDEKTAYLVPFARRLPRDLEAGFAGGRVHAPAAESLLPLRFGARSATPRLLRSRLRHVAQSEPTREYAQGDAPSIDLDDAWLLFLADRLGVQKLEADAQLFAGALLDREHRGRALAETLGAVPGSRVELETVLRLRLGSNAPRVLGAWLEDAAIDLAAMAVIGEASRGILTEARGKSFTVLATVIESRVLQAPKHPLRGDRSDGGVVGLARGLVELGLIFPLVWARLDGAEHDTLRRAVLAEAEVTLASEQVRPFALASNRLPFVFDERRRRFADAAKRLAAAPDDGKLARASRDLDGAASELLQHELSHRHPHLPEQVEMACRLGAFLCEALPASTTDPRAEIIALARFQADVGGYVDWARQVARLDMSGPLERDLKPLVARIDEVRDALDARFAASYARVVSEPAGRATLRSPVNVAGRQSEVVLIEDALARMGLDVLERANEPNFLVLCMDGMSAANLAEIWNSRPAARFEVLERRGHGPRWPILAQLPSITRLSRSALFAGRALVPGDRLDTQRDGERLADHGSVRAASASSVVLLRADILGPGGGLADDAAAAVRSATRVVGVVVNAIDDQLKGSAQLRVELSASRIPALQALLDEAASAGRLVLLVSDHGNVPSQRFIGAAARPPAKAVDGAERGARHRALRTGESPGAGEVAVPFGAIPGVGGHDRLALAVSETLRYSSMLHAGEHGGASLAEAVAPAVVLAPAGLVADLAPHGFVASELAPPSFWSRERRMAAASAGAPASAPSVAPPRRRGTPKPSAAAAVPAPQPPPPKQATFAFGFVDALVSSKLYQAQLNGIAESDHAAIRNAIDVLVRNGGRMSRDAFANEMGIGAAGRGVRVPGFLAKLERVLNVDQEHVVTMELQSQLVMLDVRLLKDIFECGDG